MFTAFRIRLLKQSIHTKDAISFLGDLGIVWMFRSPEDNIKNDIEIALKFSDEIFFHKLKQPMHLLRLNSDEAKNLQGMLQNYLSKETTRRYFVERLEKDKVKKNQLMQLK